jgi:hypothetical protein
VLPICCIQFIGSTKVHQHQLQYYISNCKTWCSRLKIQKKKRTKKCCWIILLIWNNSFLFLSKHKKSDLQKRKLSRFQSVSQSVSQYPKKKIVNYWSRPYNMQQSVYVFGWKNVCLFWKLDEGRKLKRKK